MMKTARNRLVLVMTLIALGSLGGLLLIQYRSSQSTRATELDERRSAEEARAAAKPAVEVPPIPAVETLAAAKGASDPQRKEADAQELELLVLDPEGAPIADAKVALFRGESLLVEGSTGADGLARWNAQEGTAQYAIAAWSWALALGEVELSAGRRIVTLSEGATLAGTAVVDGGVPSEPFELRWSSDPDTEERGLPKALWKSLQRPSPRFASPMARTNPDGSFRFRGLRSDAAGSLRWSAPYFLRGVQPEALARVLKLDAPRTGLVLDLVAGCELRLRVVDSEAKPLPNAQVKLERKRNLPALGERPSTSEHGADADGRCSIALGPEPFDQYIVSVAPPKTSAWEAHTLPPPTIVRGVWDVGDLAAVAARTVSVRVQDVEGKPIEGAGVYLWPAERQQLHPKTDSTGIRSVVITASEAQVGIEAFTYTSAIVDINAGESEVTATLQRNCGLEFVLADPARDREGLTLELNGPTPMFDEHARSARTGSEKIPRTATVESSTYSSGSGGNGTTSLMFRPEKDFRWRVAGLLPGQALRAKLRGGGTLLCEVEVPPLAEGEQRIVTFPIPQSARSLVVRVLSPAMEPVSDARISTREGGENLWTTSAQEVDSGGEREFRWLSGERFDFIVGSDSFAPKRVSLRPIPSGRFDVVLEPVQSAEIELVQVDGTPYVGELYIGSDAAFGQAKVTKLAPNVHRVEGLPAGDVQLSVQGRFGALWRIHHVGDPRLRIVVDEPGSIDATVHGIGRGDDHWALEVALPGSTRGFTRVGIYDWKEESGHASIKSLPVGAYELWFVHSEFPFVDPFLRVGAPANVVIDAEHRNLKVELTCPR